MRTIFGHSWQEIQEYQQGVRRARNVPVMTPDKQAEQIYSDIAKFKIPVHREVKDALSIVLPDSYRLIGDTWTHATS